MKRLKLSVAVLAAVTGLIGGKCFATNIPGNAIIGFANPDNIVPNGSGNTWFVDADNGSDGNARCTGIGTSQYTQNTVSCCTGAGAGSCPTYDCKSPTHPCLSLGYAVSLAGDGTNDVIVAAPIENNDYTENLVVNKDYLNIVCGQPTVSKTASDGLTDCFLFANTGVPLTVNNSDTHITGFSAINPLDSVSKPINLVCTGPTGCGTFGLERDSVSAYASSGNTSAIITFPASGIARIQVSDSNLDDAAIGVQLSAVGTANNLLRHNIITNLTGPLVKASTGEFTGVVDSNIFDPTCLSPFLDFSGTTNNASSVVVANNTFPLNVVALKDIKLSTHGSYVLGSNSPQGDNGTVISGSTQQATIISSHITTAAQTAFTASGTVNISDIILQTDATGLAAGTNFQITTDNASGAATVCSIAVSALGASVSKSCVSSGSMVPLQLADTKHLQVKCTVGACTGAGTITVIPQMTRAVPYASVTSAGL